MKDWRMMILLASVAIILAMIVGYDELLTGSVSAKGRSQVYEEISETDVIPPTFVPAGSVTPFNSPISTPTPTPCPSSPCSPPEVIEVIVEITVIVPPAPTSTNTQPPPVEAALPYKTYLPFVIKNQ